MGNWNTIPKHKLLKKSTLISIIRKNKNSPKEVIVVVVVVERERERVLTIFVWEKYGLNRKNDIKFIQNKMRRKRVKL